MMMITVIMIDDDEIYGEGYDGEKTLLFRDILLA